MIMNLKGKLLLVCITAVIALTGAIAPAQEQQSQEQQNLELSKPELPKIPDPKIISIGFSTDSGIGRVRAADKNGVVNQYLEIWENDKRVPNVVTYVLVANGQSYTATWGKGAVNPKAFTCELDKVPEFGEKSFWAATVKDGALSFQEIKDGDIKGLFDNLTQARRDYNREVNATAQRNNANLVENNILSLLKEKSRQKWLQQGWLQPATTCIRHFG